MSFNCLTCSQLLERTDSYRELFTEKNYREAYKQVDRDRSWSGNVSSSPKRDLPKGGAVAKIKAQHRRAHSTGNVSFPGSSEPKLIRSTGMRRNWSLENMAENQDQTVSCH